MQNGSPVERLPIELDETLPYRSPQVREEGTLALRWAAPPGNQLIVMMMLLVLNAQRGKVLTEPRAGDNRRAGETAKFTWKLGLTVLPKLALSGEEDLHWRLNAGIAKYEGGDLVCERHVLHFGTVTQPGVGVERLLVVLCTDGAQQTLEWHCCCPSYC